MMAWTKILAGLILCAAFGMWFSRQQVMMLDAGAGYPPLWLTFGTGLRVALLAFIPYTYCSAYIRKCGFAGFAAWLPLLALLPLLAVWAGVPLTWALRGSMAAFLLTAFGCHIQFARGNPRRSALRHWWALGLILVTQIIFNGYFSPLQLQNAPFNVPGSCVPEIGVMMLLFRSFIWIKQFSLSTVDYSYWLMGPHTPLSHASPAMQLMAWLVDTPSMDITAFYHLLHWLFFFMCVAGSFGFYLLLCLGMGLGWPLAAAGGMLYIFALEPFFTNAMGYDHINEISTQAVFPFALCSMLCALRSRSYPLAITAGAALAVSFVLLPPHLEMALYFLIGFGFLSIGAALSKTISLTAKDGGRLMLCGGIVFVVLSAFYLGPMVFSVITHDFYVQGHSEEAGLTLWQRVEFDIFSASNLYVFLAIMWWLFMFVKNPKTHKTGLTVSAFLLLLLLLPLHSPLLVIISELLHTDINLAPAVYGRRGYFISLCALILLFHFMGKKDAYLAFAGKISGDLKQRYKIKLSTTGVIIAIAVSLCAPMRLQPQIYDNPHHCPYYVMLQALLANYPLLKGDPANARDLMTRLARFEYDIHLRPSESYGDSYAKLLAASHIKSVTALDDAGSLYIFARKAASLVDGFYMDSLVSCVHPAETRYLIKDKRYMLPNLASLYVGLPTPFLRLAGFTARENVPGVMESYESESVSFGIGPGLFIHNAGGAYDARFMVGPVLPHALYLMPGFDMQPLGSYNLNVNWHLATSMLHNSLYRKIFDIAGFDIILLPLPREKEFAPSDGFLSITPPDIAAIKGLRNMAIIKNERSYGMAYFANHIRYVSASQIAPLERTMRNQLIDHSSPKPFSDARSALYSQLADLQEYRDIILEDEPRPAEDIPAGEVTIRNILGEAAIMKAECKRRTCELVYNMAKLPGWYAYSDGVPLPIHRANFAFMGVRVPQGSHEVWFIYAPVNFLCFTVLSLLGFILLPCFYFYRKPHEA